MNEIYSYGYDFGMVAENTQSTVIARYTRPCMMVAEGYQGEDELERTFIEQLERQGYEYLRIHSAAELEANLRLQIERLNKVQFTDGEWQRFFKQEIAAEGKGVVDKARTIQLDHRKAFTFDDGTERNIILID